MKARKPKENEKEPVEFLFRDGKLFSGKFDMKGKKIFQGDLVKFHNNCDFLKKEYWFPIYEVTWDGFSFSAKHIGGGLDSVGSFIFSLRHYSDSSMEILNPKTAAKYLDSQKGTKR